MWPFGGPTKRENETPVQVHVFMVGAVPNIENTPEVETKHSAGPDTSLDTNYQAEQIYDASLSTDAARPANYRYFSDPVTGLTAFFNAAEFDVEPIDIRSLMELPSADKLKVFPLRFIPKDGSAPFFEVLMHNKSGTTQRDQIARDAEAKLLAKVGVTLHEIYPDTNIVRYQGDINIGIFVPKNKKNITVEYLTNNNNYEVNQTGLENLFNLMTPPGAVVTDLGTPDINVKERAGNLLDNGQSWKLNFREGSSKAVSIQMEFLSFELAPEAIEAQQKAIIKKIKVPTTPIWQFGIKAFDSDHRPTAPQQKNGHTFITAALINDFGPMGFGKESDLILPSKRNQKDRARRELLKDQWTGEVYNIVMQALVQHGINTSEMSGNSTLIDAAKFIQKHEWVLMQESILRGILSDIAKLKQTTELNTHCHKNRAILNTEAKINDVLKRIFNKNYTIIIQEGQNNTAKEPDKDELINVIKIDNKRIAYALKNYTVDDAHPSQVYNGTLSFTLPANGELTEAQAEDLKKRVIQDVNRQHPVAPGQRPAAVKGSQILNNLADGCNWQLYAGFPCASEKEDWKPFEEQNKTIYGLVRKTGAGVVATTERSSKKHLNSEKVAQRDEALQRDAEHYVDYWVAQMWRLCEQLNEAHASYMLELAQAQSRAYASTLPVATRVSPPPVVASAPVRTFSFKQYTDDQDQGTDFASFGSGQPQPVLNSHGPRVAAYPSISTRQPDTSSYLPVRFPTNRNGGSGR